MPTARLAGGVRLGRAAASARCACPIPRLGASARGPGEAACAKQSPKCRMKQALSTAAGLRYTRRLSVRPGVRAPEHHAGLAPSSSLVQDISLSRIEQGFESPWGHSRTRPRHRPRPCSFCVVYSRSGAVPLRARAVRAVQLAARHDRLSSGTPSASWARDRALDCACAPSCSDAARGSACGSGWAGAWDERGPRRRPRPRGPRDDCKPRRERADRPRPAGRSRSSA